MNALSFQLIALYGTAAAFFVVNFAASFFYLSFVTVPGRSFGAYWLAKLFNRLVALGSFFLVFGLGERFVGLRRWLGANEEATVVLLLGIFLPNILLSGGTALFRPTAWQRLRALRARMVTKI